MTDYNVLAAGDTALVVDFGNQVDLNVSAKVLALAGRLNALKIDGVIETVPTIRSLSIYYEPLTVSAVRLERQVADILEHLEEAPATGRTCDIPVCYDPELAPDLEHVAAQCNLDPDRVIEIHCGRTYHVYMLGFLPGLAYLGDLPPELALPRRTTPRPKIPAGSLGIGGKLTCIYPMATPCGWHLIGRSPISLWDPALTRGALLRAGDKVRFKPISLRQYRRICADGIVAIPQPDKVIEDRMSAALRILEPGLLTTVQDLGRVGYQHLGVPTSGALDPVSFRAANILVGNAPTEGALEIAYVGPVFIVEADSVNLACAGAEVSVEVLNDEAAVTGARYSSMQSFRAYRGQVIRVGHTAGWSLVYLAVEGGFDIKPVLGSVSTYVRGHIGGWQGRALAAGDTLPLRRDIAGKRDEFRLEGLDLARPSRFRVVLGPQNMRFSDKSIGAFLDGEYTVSPATDRMAMQLNGPKLEHIGGHDIVSDGIAQARFRCPDTVNRSFSWPTGKRPEAIPKSRPLFRQTCRRSAGRGLATRFRFRKPALRKRSSCAEFCCNRSMRLRTGWCLPIAATTTSRPVF